MQRKEEETKPKLSKDPIPKISQRRHEEKIAEVKGREPAPHEDIWVLHRPGAPKRQYSEGQDKHSEECFGDRIVTVTLYPVNMDKR